MTINRINQASSSVEKLTKPKNSSKLVTTTEAPEANSKGAVSKLSDQTSSLGAVGAPFNAEKVAEIKEAISKGEFKVNPEAVAAKVIESARELLGQK